MKRREFMTGCAALGAVAAWPALAEEAWPAKPIRLIVPFPPAGGTDVLSRAISHAIAAHTKWQFVVDNKPGAGGNIGLDALAKSPPDGYTIGMGQTANLAVNPALYASMPFDPLKDLAPIVLLSSQPLIVVVDAKSPYKTIADLLAAAKANPGKVNMASAGNGTIGHVAGELFQRAAGVKFTHVPYKGAGPAVTDLLGGNVDCFFGNTQSVGGQVTGGRLRALAATSPNRIATFPEVRTLDELGWPGFEAATWSGLLAPAGTPDAIISRLNLEGNRALRTPEMRQKLTEEGSTPMGGSPAQFAAFMRSEHEKWGKAVREAGIRLD